MSITECMCNEYGENSEVEDLVKNMQERGCLEKSGKTEISELLGAQD